MADIKAARAEPAIYFDCAHCGRGQFADYTLKDDWLDGGRAAIDVIACEKCRKDNRVYMELG